MSLIRTIKVHWAKLHFWASRIPLYHLTLVSLSKRKISNKLNNTFPSEYSVDVISQSQVSILKCTGRPVLIKNIPTFLYSNDFSDEEKSELHSFEWISVLNLNIDRRWYLPMQQNITFWIEKFSKLDKLSWNIVNVSERIYNWIMQYNLISQISSAKFNAVFIKSLIRQIKFAKRLLYLPMKVSEKLRLIRAIAIGSSALNDKKSLFKSIRELSFFLEVVNCAKSCETPQEILIVLRCLIDIQSIILLYQKKVPREISDNISKLATIIKTIRHSDGGISIFRSEFTPSPSYIDALLARVKNDNSLLIHPNYLRFQSFGGSLFIDIKNRYLPIEFSTGPQRIILGTYLYFSDSKLLFSGKNKIDHEIYKDKSNSWFNGKSEFIVNDHDVTFEKKLYINKLGMDIRCEEIISTESFNILHCIILPFKTDITMLEYQNGFSMDLKNGERWIWNFDRSVSLSFDFGKNTIINGNLQKISVLSLRTISSNRVRWSMKKV
ncbi:MAG: hypothetical protein LBF57_02365 [Holosporaceae bacterium]|jgi:hypothetical protein|nr:hypothetical protein [Holosporaceae bacterium]